jgi:penicillin-binding protein 1A
MVYTKGLQVQTAMDFKHQIAAEKALRKGLLNSAKRRGWTGPAGKLKATEVQAFLSDQKLTFSDLEEKDMYRAVVIAVQEKEARVRFGSFEGRIDVKDVGWCRTPDPKKAHEDVKDIRDVRKVLKIGDVVWVSVKDDTEAIRRVAEIEWEKLQATVGNATMMGEMPMPGREHLWQLALEREPDVEGAIVSMDPVNGEVLAMVGGYDFKKSQFNRATQASRQPGSAFKPVVYSAALDNGLTPASIIQDAPIVYNDLANNRLWKPENFEGVFYGPTLLRTALVKSRNLVTIRVADRIGIGTIINRAKAMGMVSEFPRDLSVSLGSSPVTLINLVQAYSVFARGGSYTEPRMVLNVKGPWGEELFSSEPVAVDAVSPQTAYLMVNLMKEVVRGGTGWRAKVLKRQVAGKTGTSNDEQDAWFMGYTPYLLTGVYVGFDKMTPMGKWETGSRAASPIWVDYRKVVEEDYPAQDFPQPPGIVMVRIDAADGMPAGPGTKESYFLPFKAGTQPRATVDRSSPGSRRPVKEAGEDLLKQIF